MELVLQMTAISTQQVETNIWNKLRRTACDARYLLPPTAAPLSSLGPGVADASIMPTDMPIGPPDPLPYPSEDPTGNYSMILNLAYLFLCAV
jgi:hypothetical protein